jgi:hypothetical protein
MNYHQENLYYEDYDDLGFDDESYGEEIYFDDEDEGYGEYEDDDDFEAFYDDDDEGESAEFDDDDDEEMVEGRRTNRRLKRLNRRIRRRGGRPRPSRPRSPIVRNPIKARPFYMTSPKPATNSLQASLSKYATRTDVNKLANIASTNRKQNSKAILRNTKAINKGLGLTTKSLQQIKSLDAKHSRVAKEQNAILKTLSKNVDELKKQTEQAQKNAQMQGMMSMLSQPKLESLDIQLDKFKNGGATTLTEADLKDSLDASIQNAKFESNNLPLMMAMMGNQSNDKNGGMNPMMMMLLMNSL